MKLNLNDTLNSALKLIDVRRAMRRSEPSACDETNRSLSPYIDGELDTNSRQTVEGHLANCPACRAALASLTALSRAVSQRPIAELSPDMSARLRMAIADEARSARPLRRLAAQSWAFAGAVAACAIVALFATHQTFPPFAVARHAAPTPVVVAQVPPVAVAPIPVAPLPHVWAGGPVLAAKSAPNVELHVVHPHVLPMLAVRPIVGNHVQPVRIASIHASDADVAPSVPADVQTMEPAPSSIPAESPAPVVDEPKAVVQPAEQRMPDNTVASVAVQSSTVSYEISGNEPTSLARRLHTAPASDMSSVVYLQHGRVNVSNGTANIVGAGFK